MAKIKNGFGLQISGKVGSLVFCNGLLRKPYTRSLPTKRTDASPAQMATRIKMKIAMKFLNPLRPLIMNSWKAKRGKQVQPFYAALGVLMSAAIKGTYPDLFIRYEEAQLSSGNLPPASDASFLTDKNDLLIGWESIEATFKYEDDEAVVVLYHEEKEAAIIFRERAGRRDGAVLIKLPDGFMKGKLHVYLLFLSHDKKNASLSTYIGCITNDG